MGYFWRWLLLLNCLNFWSNTALSQPNIDTLKTCAIQHTDSLKKQDRSPIVPAPKAYVNEDDARMMILEYELAQKMYNKGSKDVYVQLCVNNQFVMELDSSVCGDLKRVKGRSGKLKIQFNREITGEPESIRLFGTSIESEKPPVSKWVLNSLFRPNWGHQQIKKFNQTEEELEKQIPEKEVEIGEVNELSAKNSKAENHQEKKGKVTHVIGGLLAIGVLTKLTSAGNYETAKRYYGRGDTESGRVYYNKANQQHKVFLGFTGLAIGVNLANAFSVLNKGNREMKKYRKKYPKNRQCGK